MDVRNEKQLLVQSHYDSRGRTSINIECNSAFRPSRDRGPVRQRTCHFLTIISLVLVGLIYRKSGMPLFEEVQRSEHSHGDCAAGGSTFSKSPRYYPAGVTPDVAEMRSSFNWTTHLPSRILNWTECYETYFCARLAVPLDYSEADREEAAVALIKFPAVYPPDHDNYKGPILINPGGPGSSGVSFVLRAASAFRTIIGGEFDLIGFDPRGVLFTTPQLHVFESTFEEAKFFAGVPGNVNASFTSFSEAFVRHKVLGQLAEDRHLRYASHVSTPTVATDMLSIVKASGYDKLQYWGFSYGLILGATFAAMFPNNVGRLIIDGVADSEDYYSGLWANFLQDTNAALYDIYEACARAGLNDPCPLKEDNAELIATRVNNLLAKVKEEPVPVYLSQLGEYGIVDYALVREQILQSLYVTHNGGGRTLMLLLAELEKGDGSLIYQRSSRRMIENLVKCNCSAPPEEQRALSGLTLTNAIACGDASETNLTLAEARAFYDRLSEDSTFTDVWSMPIICATWKIRAQDRFKGSFEQNTSYPLLLIGNTADPVSPLRNAYKMSRGFRNSVVLQQNASGHCCLAASSLCTHKAVRSYFINGTLPERNTVCQTESFIFAEESTVRKSLTDEERKILDAAHEVQKMHLIPPLGSIPVNLWERTAYEISD